MWGVATSCQNALLDGVKDNGFSFPEGLMEAESGVRGPKKIHRGVVLKGRDVVGKEVVVKA